MKREFTAFLEENHIDIVINNCADFLKDTCFLQDIRKERPFRLIANELCSPMAYRSSYRYKNIRFFKLYLRAWVKEICRVFYPIDKIRLKTAYRTSDRIVFLSSHFIDEFRKITGFEPDRKKTAAIPCIRTYSDPVKPDDLKKKKKIVLLVARLNEIHKRVSYALEVWRKIVRVRRDWTFVIVGDGPQKHYYENMVTGGEIPNVVFTGQADPLPYYREASIFVMTSVSEGVPMVLVDSTSCGVVPVVFHTFSSLPDIIDDGKSGFLIPDKKISLFAEKVLYLMEHDEVRNAMATAAIGKSRNFSIDRVMDKWNALLQEIK